MEIKARKAEIYNKSLEVAEYYYGLEYEFSKFNRSPFEYAQLLKGEIYNTDENIEKSEKVTNIEEYNQTPNYFSMEDNDWDIFLLDVLDGEFIISDYNGVEIKDLILSYLFDDKITLKYIKTQLNDTDLVSVRLDYPETDDIERLQHLDERLKQYSKNYREYII